MHAFHVGVGICAALVGLGGVLGLVGIRNPRTRAASTSGGQPPSEVRVTPSPRAS